ncbi:MAG: di-trans,poly-cis-decaprenylcistransferase [Clostridia bacterium]|nr:di-trans,poly-cis-decaprenylcistransferase [Clostridia bacterium]
MMPNLFNIFKKKEKSSPSFEGTAPKHIAFILDGNGRWAQKRSLPRKAGHRAGAETLENILNACRNTGVLSVTVYAFSTENWKRSDDEIDGIIGLLDTYLDIVMEKYSKDTRVRFLGDLSPFPDNIREKIKYVEDSTKDNVYNLNVCLNYGGRAEICRAFDLLCEKGVKHATEEDISSELYTSPTGDPDIIIRTGGEHRLSNFLLWQASYAELYFTDTLWPDFSKEELFDIFAKFSKTNRRYGGYDDKKENKGGITSGVTE